MEDRNKLKRVILLLGIIMVFLITCTVSAEHTIWDCPECGRTGNTGNYCGNCQHPAPWISGETKASKKTWSVEDVLLLQKYLAGWDITVDTKVYDVNNDGTINIADVLTIQKILMHWNT